VKGGEKVLTRVFTQNLAFGFLDQMFAVKGQANGYENNVPEFKDVFESINIARNRVSVTKRDNEANSSRKTQNKTFNMSGTERRNNVPKTHADNKSFTKAENCCKEDNERNDVKTKEDPDQKTKPDIAAVIFAQMLGIELTEFEKILELAGLSMKDFSNEADAGQIVEGLTTFAGLDSGEELLLKDMIDFACKEAEVVLSGTSNIEIQENTALPVMDGSLQQSAEWADNVFHAQNVELISIQEKFEKAAEQLRLKFRELLAKNNIIKETVTGKSDENINIADSEGIAVLNANSAKVTGSEKAHEEKEQNKTSSNGSGFDLNEATSGVVVFDTASDNLEGKELSVIQNIKTDANGSEGAYFSYESTVWRFGNNVGNTVNVDNRVPISKADIFNQIVEKAKVLLDREKAEMVVHLKPDSLGKLSMRIITEKGIVMAEFIAENQQVKEILESNMQLLRNVLENQGLSVQGFNVSVRQDSSSQSRWNHENNANRKLTAMRLNLANVASNAIGEVVQNIPVMNLLNFSESKINITA